MQHRQIEFGFQAAAADDRQERIRHEEFVVVADARQRS